MFVSFLPFSLSEKSQAMFWWLWISLNTCHWRTYASFVGPNSMKSDMLWRYFLTTEKMVTLDSGNLAWRTWRVSETCKCHGLVSRKKKRACWIFAPMPSVTCILQIMEVAREAGSCTFYFFCFTKVLFSLLIKGCVWKSCIWNKNSCWKSSFFFILVLRACWFPCDPWLLHECSFRCYVFSAKLA